jgi:hypothetical protein
MGILDCASPLTHRHRVMSALPQRWGNRPAFLWIAEDFGVHWQIGRLFPLEYLSDVDTDKTIRIRYIRTAANQPAVCSKLAILVDRRQCVL